MKNNTKMILVVDDEKSIRDMLRDLLTDENFIVICASDGTNALAVLENNNFDLVLCDVHMPNMDGIDFVVEMGKRHKKTPIIAMSGEAKDDSKLSSSLRNLEKYAKVPVIEKPFSVEKLLDLINGTIDKQ